MDENVQLTELLTVEIIESYYNDPAYRGHIKYSFEDDETRPHYIVTQTPFTTLAEVDSTLYDNTAIIKVVDDTVKDQIQSKVDTLAVLLGIDVKYQRIISGDDQCHEELDSPEDVFTY